MQYNDNLLKGDEVVAAVSAPMRGTDRDDPARGRVSAQTRASLFISHAVEDNDFVLWLGARLSAAGYDVWADVLRLKGGDDWQRVLEDALRNKAAKMLWVATEFGTTKQGVRNEIQIASDIGRKIGDDSFIVPLKLEACDAPFLAVHIQWIDFRKGWGAGLAELLETLEQIPTLVRTEGLHQESMARWMAVTQGRAAKVKDETEVLVSNWISLSQTPATVRYYEFKGAGAEQQAIDAVASYVVPAAIHGAGFFGFGSPADYVDTPSGISPRLVEEIPFDEFREHGVRAVQLQPHDARNKLSILIRLAFEAFLSGKGLSAYQFSGRTIGFWVNSLLIPSRVAFDWKNGWKGSRALIGDAKKFRWHYCVSIHVKIEKETYVQITPRVIFTENGTAPIASASKMHALRRSVPRGWRNDRWRDLLLAFLSWVSGGDPYIDLPVGEDRVLRFAAMPITMQSPVSIVSEADALPADISLEEGDPVFEAGHVEESDETHGE